VETARASTRRLVAVDMSHRVSVASRRLDAYQRSAAVVGEGVDEELPFHLRSRHGTLSLIGAVFAFERPLIGD
jgi:hypothetical protein